MKKILWIRGISALTAFFGAFFLCTEIMLESSATFTNLVDSVIGNTKTTGSANASDYMYTSDFSDTKSLLSKRKDIAVQLSEEGCVLLKNNGTLPLRTNPSDSSELKVTLLGTRAFQYKANGGSRDGNNSVFGGICGSRTYTQSVVTNDGVEKLPWTLVDALKQQNITVNPKCISEYSNKNFTDIPSGGEASGTSSGPFSSKEPRIEVENVGKDYSDASIVFIGRSSGEGRDYLPGPDGVADKTDGSKSALHLNDNERHLIEVAKEISNKVIVLVNSAIPMEIEELKNNPDVDSIMWIGLPGSYGMLGVANLIAGQVAPSGHLADTFAVDNSKSPAAINFGYMSQNGEKFTWKDDSVHTRAWNGHYVVLAEGIYTGYYYYETRYVDAVEGNGNATGNFGLGREANNNTWSYEDEVSYTFGYGLEYSTFSEEFVQENGKTYTYNEEKKTVDFKVKVKNTGEVKGKHAVQLYVSTPYTSYDIAHKIEKSAVQLIDFGKTEMLEKGEEQIISLSAPLKYFASFDETVNHDGVTGGYILDKGDYYFSIGNGAHEAANNMLVKKDSNNESKLYLENNIQADANKSVKWNPTDIASLASDFDGDINYKTLAKSENNVVISNQLQEVNYNHYVDNAVNYLTRSNWESFPKAYANLEATEEMKNRLGNSDYSGHEYKVQNGPVEQSWSVDHGAEEDEKGDPLENMVVAQFKGKGFDDPNWEYLIEQISFNDAYLFCPTGGSFCNPIKSISSPQVWQVDGPNGFTNYGLGKYSPAKGIMAIASNDSNYNYMSNDMCAEPTKACTFNKELLKEEGKQFGENAMWARTPIAWAPGMNSHRCPWNSRNHEYYSEDPMLTNICGANFVQGGLEKGAILSPKHFGLNTQEGFREGLAQFTTEQAAREKEFRGFQGTVEDTLYENSIGTKIRGSLGLMTSFSRLGVHDTNNHSGLMKNVLREEWGFKGLISTDYVTDAYYFNPLDCVYNNVTIMACGSGEACLNKTAWSDYGNKDAIKKDPNINKALQTNMHHYLYAISNSSALNGFNVETTVSEVTTLKGWQKMFYGIAYSGLGLGVIAYGIYSFLVVKQRKEMEA